MSWCSLRTWGLAAVALVASGCAQTVHSQVSSYSQLTRQRSALSYAIVPLKDQRKDQAFKSYEERVRAHLQAYGFVPEEFDRAEYIVAMAYVDDDRGDAISSYPIIGQSGSSSSRMSGTMLAYSNTTSYSTTTAHTPAYDVVEADAVDSDDLTSVLRLDIVRRASIGRGHIEKVYEGEVLSSADGRALPTILPAMIEALFQDFPGADGEVRHVTSKSVPTLDEIASLHAASACPGGPDCPRDEATIEEPPRAPAANARAGRCAIPGTSKLMCASRKAR
jgi:hypothetical protein